MRDALSTAEAIAWLRSPAAIRARCGQILAAAEDDRLRHFALDPERLDPAADYVVETIRETYPSLDIPYHSRWRHFAAGGRDRWGGLAARLTDRSPEEIARTRFDLVVLSVLLDAGAGPAWRYVEPATGTEFVRSEGLAVASLDLFTSGLCSSQADDPLRADADALMRLDPATLAHAFQVRDDNPLVGLGGRVQLLNQLGASLPAQPERFGRMAPRIGGLFDHLAAKAVAGHLPAPGILAAVLDGFGAIWPGQIELGGVNLGDVGRHPLATADDATDSLVPFHKLSQWLTYSLIEPIQDAGIEVTDLDQLTALAEYRNGGLLIDLGVLVPKHPGVLGRAHPGSSEIIVEWRALTAALLDRLAQKIRAKLDRSATELPLAKILEGGTWSAGRRIAGELRADGGPPLQLESDGTLF